MAKTTDNLNKRIFSSIRWQAIFDIFTKLVTPITFIILARFLSPEDFGVLAIIWLVISISQLVMEMGLSAAIIQKKRIDDTHITTAFLVNLSFGLALIIIFYFISQYIADFFNMPQLSSLLKVVSVIFLIDAFGSVQQALLTRELLFKKISTVRIFATLMYSVFVITLALAGFGIWSIIYGQIISSAISSILFWVMSDWKPHAIIFQKEKFIDLFGFGSGVLFNKIVGQISNVDTILIGKFLEAYSLGLYTISRQVGTMLPQMLVGIVSTVIFPAFSRIQDNKNAIGKMYLDAIKYLSILGVPVTVGLIFIAPEFVEFFLTEKWIGIIPIIQLLSLFSLANVIGGGLWGATLYSLGYSYKVLKLTLIRLIALTFFVSMGIYLGGLIEVIIGIVIYGFIFRFAYQHIINKWIEITMIDYLKVLIPSFCCAISMSFILIIYKLYLSTMMINIVNLILMIIIGTISYSIFLKTLFPKEFKLLFDFFREPISSINIKYKNG